MKTTKIVFILLAFYYPKVLSRLHGDPTYPFQQNNHKQSRRRNQYHHSIPLSSPEHVGLAHTKIIQNLQYNFERKLPKSSLEYLHAISLEMRNVLCENEMDPICHSHVVRRTIEIEPYGYNDLEDNDNALDYMGSLLPPSFDMEVWEAMEELLYSSIWIEWDNPHDVIRYMSNKKEILRKSQTILNEEDRTIGLIAYSVGIESAGQWAKILNNPYDPFHFIGDANYNNDYPGNRRKQKRNLQNEDLTNDEMQAKFMNTLQADILGAVSGAINSIFQSTQGKTMIEFALEEASISSMKSFGGNFLFDEVLGGGNAQECNFPDVFWCDIPGLPSIGGMFGGGDDDDSNKYGEGAGCLFPGTPLCHDDHLVDEVIVDFSDQENDDKIGIGNGNIMGVVETLVTGGAANGSGGGGGGGGAGGFLGDIVGGMMNSMPTDDNYFVDGFDDDRNSNLSTEFDTNYYGGGGNGNGDAGGNNGNGGGGILGNLVEELMGVISTDDYFYGDDQNSNSNTGFEVNYYGGGGNGNGNSGVDGNNGNSGGGGGGGDFVDIVGGVINAVSNSGLAGGDGGSINVESILNQGQGDNVNGLGAFGGGGGGGLGAFGGGGGGSFDDGFGDGDDDLFSFDDGNGIEVNDFNEDIGDNWLANTNTANSDQLEQVQGGCAIAGSPRCNLTRIRLDDGSVINCATPKSVLCLIAQGKMKEPPEISAIPIPQLSQSTSEMRAKEP